MKHITGGIYFGNQAHGRAIAVVAGCLYHPDTDIVISREKDGLLQGGVVFQEFTGASIAAHVAGFSPQWLTRDHLWVAFDYAFRYAGCKSIFAQIRSRSNKGLDFVRKIGFNIVATIEGVYPDGEDLVIARLQRDAVTRFLRVVPKGLRGAVSG